MVARLGTAVFAVALAFPLVLPADRAQSSVLVAAAHEAHAPRIDPGVVDGLTALELPERRLPARTLARAATASVDGSAAVLGVQAAPPLVLDGTVLASWYGPGFYGNRTACGQTYTPEITGVAHRTLRCGTLVRITSPRGNVVTVPVIDRGPYVAGRSLDLANATRLALACTDLCRIHMLVIQ